MTRTIVLSDIHGHRSLIDSALSHAGFSAGDRLVLAGDVVDVGTDDVIALATELGATILAGNHEVAAALGLSITPQNPETRLRRDEFAEKFASGQWPLAFAAEGWLITHAGISIALDDIYRQHPGDAAGLAADLNARFAAEMRAAISTPQPDWAGIERFRLLGGAMGPLWFRPEQGSQLAPINQIAGHTPVDSYPPVVVRDFTLRGMLLIDMAGHDRAPAPGRFRYALVEDGMARVFDSSDSGTK